MKSDCEIMLSDVAAEWPNPVITNQSKFLLALMLENTHHVVVVNRSGKRLSCWQDIAAIPLFVTELFMAS